MNAKRILFLTTLVLGSLAIPRTADCQVLISLLLGDKVSSEKFHLGINIGANLSNLSNVDGTKWRTGFFLAVNGEWHFAKHWYLQPEITAFNQMGANNMPIALLPPPPEFEDELQDAEVRRKLNYLSIPILVKYGLAQNRFLIGAGPQVGFVTSGKDVYTGVVSSNGNKVEVEQDIKDSLGTDFGVLFHLEYKIRPGAFSPSINGRFYLGLTDTVKDNTSGTELMNRAFTLFLTIPVGGKKAVDEAG